MQVGHSLHLYMNAAWSLESMSSLLLVVMAYIVLPLAFAIFKVHFLHKAPLATQPSLVSVLFFFP